MARLFLGTALQKKIKRSPQIERAVWHADLALVRLIWRTSASLPIDRASALGDWLGRRVGPRLGKRHHHLMRNLSVAFPERDGDWIQRTAVASWGQIGRVLAEYPHLPSLTAGDLNDRIEVVAHFDLEPVRRGERPLLFAAAHLGNWNLAASGGAIAGLPLSVVFARHNPLVEQLVERWRRAVGTGFIDAATGARAIIAELKSGRSVGLFMDHRIDAGEMVPFFGIKGLTTTVPARVAAKLGIGLVPSRVERLDGARFRLTLHEPIYADPETTDLRQAARRMTEHVYAHFEQWIRERPEQWVCAKRRWAKADMLRHLAGKASFAEGVWSPEMRDAMALGRIA